LFINYSRQAEYRISPHQASGLRSNYHNWTQHYALYPIDISYLGILIVFLLFSNRRLCRWTRCLRRL